MFCSAVATFDIESAADIVGFGSALEATNQIAVHPSRIDALIVFEPDKNATSSVISGLKYRLLLNSSITGKYANMNLPWHFPALQDALNQAIMKHIVGPGTAVDVSVSISPFEDIEAVNVLSGSDTELPPDVAASFAALLRLAGTFPFLPEQCLFVEL